MDAITPPAPWLGPRIREELQRRRRETLVERARRRPGEFAWLLPAVAVLLAIAVIVTMTLTHRLTVPLPLPVRPHSGAVAGCPTWGYVPGGPNEPSSLKMFSLTTGWAPGGLRTTDGGATWHDVTPKSLRSGEPFLPGQQTVYPPNYSDFFLDAGHGWLVRSYQTDAACTDHFTVFRTSDGGRTWRSSDINAGAASAPALSFLDAQHGWLMLTVPNPTSHTTPSPRARAVAQTHTAWYRTTDGGASWHSSSTGPDCAVVFTSPGNNGGVSQFDNCATLPGDTGQIVFFDSSHGAAFAGTTVGSSIYVTSDGGRTWQQTSTAQSGSSFVPGGFEPYNVPVWFEDQHDFWVFVSQPGWAKGGTETDWLYHSSDGGNTWELVQQNTPVGSVQSVSFVDPSHGFVLQTDTQGAIELLVTSDGGHTWTPV